MPIPMLPLRQPHRLLTADLTRRVGEVAARELTALRAATAADLVPGTPARALIAGAARALPHSPVEEPERGERVEHRGQRELQTHHATPARYFEAQ